MDQISKKKKNSLISADNITSYFFAAGKPGWKKLYIIPYNAFRGRYHEVLFSLQKDKHITNSERQYLYELSKFAYRDGRCFPRQKTIAKKLGLCSRQVRRITTSLRLKGLTDVRKPDLVERHLYRKGNEYFFLFHELYRPFLKGNNPEMSSEMSSENSYHTFYNIKYNKQPHPAGTSLPNKHYQRLIQKIHKRCKKINRFDIRIFIKKYQKAYPVEAVKQTLDAIWQKMTECTDKIMFRFFEWWGYGVQIIRKIGGNINEQESIRQAQKYKNMQFPKQLTDLMSRNGNTGKRPIVSTSTCSRIPEKQQQPDGLVQNMSIKMLNRLDAFIRNLPLTDWEKKRVRKGKMYALRQKYVLVFKSASEKYS